MRHKEQNQKGKLSLGYLAFFVGHIKKTQFIKAQGPVAVGEKGSVA